MTYCVNCPCKIWHTDREICSFVYVGWNSVTLQLFWTGTSEDCLDDYPGEVRFSFFVWMLHTIFTQGSILNLPFIFLCVFVVMLLQLSVHSSNSNHEVEMDAIEMTDFLCLLDSANKLNCSWSFGKLNENAQLSVGIRYTLHGGCSLNTAMIVVCVVF